jgi:predicted metal-dependent enzyme (double-stranded beta helix superfamily)
MASSEEFVAACQQALGEADPRLAIRELVERAARSGGLDDLSDKPGVRVLWHDDALAVAHVVIPPGVPKSLPHDHRVWAVIGICAGQEHNEFFRRSAGSLAASGGRVVESGEVLSLGSEVVHAVGNPLTHEASSALHVYGGDLLSIERSMWTEPDWREEPYDAMRATGTTFVTV